MPTLQQIERFRKLARAKGLSEAQISASIARKQQEEAKMMASSTRPQISSTTQSLPTMSVPQKPPKSLGGLAKNAVQDVVDFGINTPIETGKNILGVGFEGARAVKSAFDRKKVEKKRKELEKATQAFKNEKDPEKQRKLMAKSKLISKELEQITGNMMGNNKENPFVDVNALPKSQKELGGAVLQNIGNTLGLTKNEEGRIIFDPQLAIDSAYERPVTTALMAKDLGGGVRKITGKGTTRAATKDIGLLEKTGAKITKAGEDMTLRSLKPTPSQLTAFKKATGQDLAKFMSERNLTGEFSTASKKAIDTLQGNFDEIAVSSGKQITRENIRSSFSPIIEELKNSKLSANKAKAAKLEEELDGILNGIDDVNDISVVTEIRRSADDLARQYGQDPANADLYQLVRDGLQDTVRKETRDIKIEGMNIQEIGEELHRWREFEKIAARQENLGKGSKLMGLTKSVMTGGGGATAGIPGAAAGYAISTILESPKVIGGTSRVLQNLGEKISKGESLTGNIAGKIPGVLKVPTGRGVGLAGANALDVNQPTEEVLPTTGEEQTVDVTEESGGDMFAQKEQVSSHPIFGNVSKKDLLQQAFLSGLNGKQLDEIEKIYDRFSAETEEKVELTDAAITKISDTRSAIRDVTRLGETIKASELTGPLKGFRAKNPYDTDSRELQAEIDRVRQKVGKALEGGVLRKEDEEKYKKILPTMTDTKEVALAKIEKLERTLAQDLEDFVYIQSNYGKGRTGQTDQQLSVY